ncbi:YkuS family protein [Fervidicola ferrireducens]|nr:YkuS family protein [Fervidicola ferrireducens]
MESIILPASEKNRIGGGRMTRVIAVEDGLEDLSEYLTARGFIAMPWSKVNGPVDAVIYRGKKLKEITAMPFAALTEQTAEELYSRNSFGVLLVNAEGRTREEIYEIIKNRIYDHFI